VQVSKGTNLIIFLGELSLLSQAIEYKKKNEHLLIGEVGQSTNLEP